MGEKHFKTWIYVVLSLLLLTTVSGCTSDLNPRSFFSSCQYSININADGPVENVTFIIPLPVKNRTPMLGPEVLKTNDFIQENVTIEFTKTPLGLYLGDAENITGYDPWFVIIRADRLVPKEPGNRLYYMKKAICHTSGKINSFVNTLNPIGNESLIVPKFNFIWQQPQVDKITSTRIRYNTQAIAQKTRIYADYQTNSSTHVEISFYLRNHNEWRQGYDTSLANTFSDFFSVRLKGSQKDWMKIDGKFGLTSGVYPNPENPEWQKVLNQTV